MLQLSNFLINRPVLSLRVGRAIATAVAPIINPDNLKIEGFHCIDHQTRKRLILISQDIRDMMAQGIVINDADALSEPGELVRLEKILKINFELMGKQVETTSRSKVGKVSDYAVDAQSMYIQKIYIAQSILKSFTGGNLGIDRTQIVEITDKKIVINDLEQKVRIQTGAVAA